MLYLTAPAKEDVEAVRLWRNQAMEVLRTPFMLTQEMQEDFYANVICNRHTSARYWSVVLEKDGTVVGLTGLVGIEWENRLAEISLMIDPEQRENGYGEEALAQLLRKGFHELNLENIYGECYLCNPATIFWKKMIKKYGALTTELPRRKFWHGRYWNSLYFNFERNVVKSVIKGDGA